MYKNVYTAVKYIVPNHVILPPDKIFNVCIINKLHIKYFLLDETANGVPYSYTTICLILYIIFLIMEFINKSISLRNFAKENVYVGGKLHTLTGNWVQNIYVLRQVTSGIFKK